MSEESKHALKRFAVEMKKQFEDQNPKVGDQVRRELIYRFIRNRLEALEVVLEHEFGL